MKQFNNFPEFNKKEDQKSGDNVINEKKSFKQKINILKEKINIFYKEKISKNEIFIKLQKLLKQDDNEFSGLKGIRKKNTIFEKINLALTILLIIVLISLWKTIPSLLADADQLRNDLLEQKQVIEMEEKNNKSLRDFDNKRNELQKNINIVYSVVPSSDEKAEEIISMLETIGAKCRIAFDSIGIRKIPETQFFYDDLVGVVQPYEYTISIESGLPNILSFVELIRSSLRLMDIMSIEIEEGKNNQFKASFSIYAYNNVDNN